jgi:UDP:flavonoid glycosyltransferase YjiC (YdhE family)
MLKRLSIELQNEFNLIQHLAPSADILVGSQTSLALPLVARTLKKKWVFAAVSPLALWSLSDPPFVHGLRRLRTNGGLPGFVRSTGVKTLRLVTKALVPQYVRLERQLGLPHLHPFFEGRYSPYGNLALFSPYLASAQTDWPAPYVQCGFTYFQGAQQFQGQPTGSPSAMLQGTENDLEVFLNSGPPPLVFTLGSISRLDPRDFYRDAIGVSKCLGMRAVLVRRRSLDIGALPQGMIACHFADYPSLFAKGRLIVHHGGVGTLALALRAGKPSLIVPRALDQFDQAYRAERLGIARVLPFSKINSNRMLQEIKHLLNSPGYDQAAQSLATRLQSEDGVSIATDAIEQIILQKSLAAPVGFNSAAIDYCI